MKVQYRYLGPNTGGNETVLVTTSYSMLNPLVFLGFKQMQRCMLCIGSANKEDIEFIDANTGAPVSSSLQAGIMDFLRTREVKQ